MCDFIVDKDYLLDINTNIINGFLKNYFKIKILLWRINVTGATKLDQANTNNKATKDALSKRNTIKLTHFKTETQNSKQPYKRTGPENNDTEQPDAQLSSFEAKLDSKYATKQEVTNLETQHNATSTKVGNLETQYNATSTKLDNLETQHNATSTKVDNLETQYNATITKLDNLETQHNATSTKVDNLETQ
ncbi:hypothetical protein SZ25_00864, partial [Candidatus Arcanobacter lacustris]